MRLQARIARSYEVKSLHLFDWSVVFRRRSAVNRTRRADIPQSPVKGILPQAIQTGWIGVGSLVTLGRSAALQITLVQHDMNTFVAIHHLRDAEICRKA